MPSLASSLSMQKNTKTAPRASVKVLTKMMEQISDRMSTMAIIQNRRVCPQSRASLKVYRGMMFWTVMMAPTAVGMPMQISSDTQKKNAWMMSTVAKSPRLLKMSTPARLAEVKQFSPVKAMPITAQWFMILMMYSRAAKMHLMMQKHSLRTGLLLFSLTMDLIILMTVITTEANVMGPTADLKYHLKAVPSIDDQLLLRFPQYHWATDAAIRNTMLQQKKYVKNTYNTQRVAVKADQICELAGRLKLRLVMLMQLNIQQTEKRIVMMVIRTLTRQICGFSLRKLAVHFTSTILVSICPLRQQNRISPQIKATPTNTPPNIQDWMAKPAAATANSSSTEKTMSPQTIHLGKALVRRTNPIERTIEKNTIPTTVPAKAPFVQVVMPGSSMVTFTPERALTQPLQAAMHQPPMPRNTPNRMKKNTRQQMSLHSLFSTGPLLKDSPWPLKSASHSSSQAPWGLSAMRILLGYKQQTQFPVLNQQIS